jgi:uncharacterized protein DUF4333
MFGLLPAVRRRNHVGITFAVMAAVVLLAGCDVSTTEIDSKQAEDFVKGAFEKPPRSVKCPSGVEAKTGGTFTCKAVDSTGKRYDVTLHMADDEGRVTVGKKDFKPVGGSG